MPQLSTIIAAVVALLVGIFIGIAIRKSIAEKKVGSAETQAKNIVLDAENRAEQVRRETLAEARGEAHQIRQDAERDIHERREDVKKAERRIQQKEESIDKKLDSIEKKEESISRKLQSISDKEKELEEFRTKQIAELERISGCTADEAKAQLLSDIEQDVRREASVMIKEIEAKAKEEADREAKEIITGAIQRCAADHVAETTVSVVALPNDEMKGRIIGREGRNIRAIETATGVDLIIDDTPEAVILSGFDPVRREIARIALERLIVDGRIHPARIEEMVEKATKEVNQIIKNEGEAAVFELGIVNAHPELIKLLGRLKYRTSYGQNVLQHSIEVARLAGLMAGELGFDVKLAQRAGLFHDIGKSIDHEVQGTHVDIGMDILKKYKESEAVINGMKSHHGDYEPENIEAVLVAAADALSAARPGARRETLDTYVKRLQNLEEIANTTPGVETSYAIQAGREIRIIAKPDEVNDDAMAMLARDISKKIESELEYPGQIKVNVIRETRAIDYAK
ncbi:MAG: ribonuclease Y [Clostridia bacterium]|nr:ribonuclease Y [Clostridia bacterium]